MFVKVKFSVFIFLGFCSPFAFSQTFSHIVEMGTYSNQTIIGLLVHDSHLTAKGWRFNLFSCCELAETTVYQKKDSINFSHFVFQIFTLMKSLNTKGSCCPKKSVE